MKQLTDIQICKRIAEIEGLDFSVEDYGVFVAEFIPNYNNSESNEYNPLTDKSLWNDLIFKYEVSISFVTCTLLMIRDGVYESNFTDIPSLVRNALLLIIEAHKE